MAGAEPRMRVRALLLERKAAVSTGIGNGGRWSLCEVPALVVARVAAVACGSGNGGRGGQWLPDAYVVVQMAAAARGVDNGRRWSVCGCGGWYSGCERWCWSEWQRLQVAGAMTGAGVQCVRVSVGWPWCADEVVAVTGVVGAATAAQGTGDFWRDNWRCAFLFTSPGRSALIAEEPFAPVLFHQWRKRIASQMHM